MRNFPNRIGSVFYPIIIALAFLQLTPQVLALESVEVTVDPTTVVRDNNRHLMGHNFSFADKGFGTWDTVTKEFENTFWQPFKDVAPGIVRFPGGNWTYGYHFDLARQEIAHQVNARKIPPSDMDFGPQHFLKLIKDLNAQGVESTPLIHPSAQFTSPEEAAAWVAYMIAPSGSNCRTIGPDSWGRMYQGISLQWHDTCYWGAQRELDNPDDPGPYTGTLYLQLGNEEWIKKCNINHPDPEKKCVGMTDAYGMTRHQRAMSVQQETGIPPQVTAYWPKYQALWAKLRGLSGLYTAAEIQVGPLGYAGILDPRGEEDRFLKNNHDWNQVLLTNISNATNTDFDFLTIHLYMYDRKGWQKHSATEMRHNLFASHDHLRARIEEIRNQVSPPLNKPIYITEYNTHHSGFIPASSLLDALHLINWTVDAMYNDAIDGLIRWQTVIKRFKLEIDETGVYRPGNTLFVTRTKDSSDDIWKMSSFYAAKLLANLHPKVVDVAVAAHTGFRPKGFNADWDWWEGYDPVTGIGPEIPFISAAATIAEDGSEMSLLLLNRNTVEGYSVSLNLGSFTPNSEYTRIELDSIDLGQGHNDLFDQNEHGTGAVERVALQESVGVYGGMIDIEPHQAVVIKLSAATLPNLPPIADAGVNQSVNEGAQVLLDGSASHDVDGSIVSYQWLQIDGPAVMIANPTSAQATFVAPEVTGDSILEFKLTVTDDDTAASSATSVVTVLNIIPPPADPGLIAVLNGDSSTNPIVDFTAGETTVQVSYSNPEGHSVRGVVERWVNDDDDGGWRLVTTINEARGETTPGLSPGWVDLGSKVFNYDGKLENGNWAFPRHRTRAFRMRLRFNVNGQRFWAGDWVQFRIKR